MPYKTLQPSFPPSGTTAELRCQVTFAYEVSGKRLATYGYVPCDSPDK